MRETSTPLLLIFIAPFMLLSIGFLFTPYPYLSLVIPLGLLLILLPSDKKALIFYAVIFTIPFYRLRIPAPRYPYVKLDYLITLILILFVVADIIIQKRFPQTLKAGVWKWLALFGIVNLISSILSPYRAFALNQLIFKIVIAYIFIALCLICIDKYDFTKRFPLILSIAVSLSAAIALFGYVFKIPFLTSEIPEGIRGAGLTIGANNMALMCIFTVPISLHFVLEAEKRWERVIWLIICFLSIGGIVISFSRGGFIVLAITLILLFIHHSSRITVRNLGVFLASAGLIFAVLILFTPKEYIIRQANFLRKGTQTDYSTQRRAAYIKVAFESFKKHPFLGTGTWTFPMVWFKSIESRGFKKELRPAHNTYLDVLIGTGIIGLTLFVIILLYCYSSFSLAQRLAQLAGQYKLASLIASYKISFLSIAFYFFLKSGIHHKFFLISIALSQIAYRIAKKYAEA